MKRLSKRDVPAGAAITVAALALLASVVTGREEGRAPDRIVEAVVQPAPPVASEELDLDRLKRPKRDGEIQDLFAGRSWNPPPVRAAPAPAVVEKPAPPPAPSTPPLPFKYLGRMADAERLVVFLERNQIPLSASVGDRLENDYEVVGIGESAVTFIYLPLGTQQVLNIAAPQ
jgi:hypothetical protein